MIITTQITMTSLEIAELTDKEHRNVLADIRTMLVEIGHDVGLLPFQQSYLNSQNKAMPMFSLPQKETLLLVSGYSTLLREKIIDRMTELENIQRLKSTPVITSIELEESRKRTLQSSAEWMCRMLNLEGSAKLAITEHTLRLTAPEHLKMLPAYAIDAPRTEDGKLISTGEGSSMTTSAATDLLRKHKVELSSVKFNRLLEERGYLETLERPSSSQDGAIRTFKGVTKLGLKYGKNLTNAKSQSETQPHWYREKFAELLSVLGL